MPLPPPSVSLPRPPFSVSFELLPVISLLSLFPVPRVAPATSVRFSTLSASAAMSTETIDTILPLTGQFDDLVILVVDNIDIVACTADHRVIADRTDERVVAGAAGQAVIHRHRHSIVVAGRRHQPSHCRIADQHVVASEPGQLCCRRRCRCPDLVCRALPLPDKAETGGAEDFPGWRQEHTSESVDLTGIRP